MSNTIEISGDTVMRQAHMTAHDFLLHAKADVEAVLGKGATEKHSEIVAAYLQTGAIDGGATIIARQIRAGLDAIAEAISNDDR
jgi:hypothetical protein